MCTVCSCIRNIYFNVCIMICEGTIFFKTTNKKMDFGQNRFFGCCFFENSCMVSIALKFSSVLHMWCSCDIHMLYLSVNAKHLQWWFMMIIIIFMRIMNGACSFFFVLNYEKWLLINGMNCLECYLVYLHLYRRGYMIDLVNVIHFLWWIVILHKFVSHECFNAIKSQKYSSIKSFDFNF